MTELFEKKYGLFKDLFDPGTRYKLEYGSIVSAREETAKERLLRPKN